MQEHLYFKQSPLFFICSALAEKVWFNNDILCTLHWISSAFIKYAKRIKTTTQISVVVLLHFRMKIGLIRISENFETSRSVFNCRQFIKSWSQHIVNRSSNQCIKYRTRDVHIVLIHVLEMIGKMKTILSGYDSFSHFSKNYTTLHELHETKEKRNESEYVRLKLFLFNSWYHNNLFQDLSVVSENHEEKLLLVARLQILIIDLTS